MTHSVGKPGGDVLRLLRLDQPAVGEAQCAYVENMTGISGQPDHIPANWPRLAEAGGRSELDLALEGRKAVLEGIGQSLLSLWGGYSILHVAAYPVPQRHSPAAAAVGGLP